MKRTAVAIVTGMLIGSLALASDDAGFPSSAEEVPLSMTSLESIDWWIGGFRGWGPIANPQTPWAPSEAGPSSYDDDMRATEAHLAEVRAAREHVWLANAPLRLDYNMRVQRALAYQSRGPWMGRTWHHRPSPRTAMWRS